MANYKRGGGNGIALKIYAAITSILVAASAVVMGVGFGTGRWQIAPKDEPVQEQPGEDEAGGAVIGEGEENGISLTSASISPEDFESYGVSPLAETAYTVTITPEPADAMDTYTWTCDNTQQIQLSPSSDTKSCTVSCTGAFGTQATITIASAVNTDITATVTVDYVKRVESVSISYGADKIKFGDSETQYTVTATPVYGTGTITPDFKINFGSLSNNLSGLTTELPGLKGKRKAALKGVSFGEEGNIFNISTPDEAFISYTFTSATNSISAMSNDVTPFKVVNDYPTEAALIAAYNNSFIDAVTGTTNDGTLTINYTVSYTPESDDVQGSFSDTGTATLDVAFDVSELVVNASNFTPSDTGLVY